MEDSVLERIGWWEWVVLPGISNAPVKAKCDTGAVLSALHAEDLTIVQRGSLNMARFRLSPDHDFAELTIIEDRQIKSSNGLVQHRPVVLTPVEINRHVIAIQCTLTNRTPMAYPMLLGRAALGGRYLVDPSHAPIYRKPRTRKSN
jgi:ribosomal protein S6--L-glutamate ligase